MTTTWHCLGLQYDTVWGYSVRIMVFNATFNNIPAISSRSILLLEETGENDRPVASHWQTSSHDDVSNTPPHKRIRTVRAFPKSNIKIIGRDKIDTTNSQIHYCTIYKSTLWSWKLKQIKSKSTEFRRDLSQLTWNYTYNSTIKQ